MVTSTASSKSNHSPEKEQILKQLEQLDIAEVEQKNQLAETQHQQRALRYIIALRYS